MEEIISFYQDFYKRSKMEHDTIIMSLIYVERLIKETNGVIAPVPGNWKSLLFSCMVLASKVWDDMSMWNIDFSNVCGRGQQLTSFTLTRINQLELALLKSLNFNVKVRASEYAKYYFLIRSMLIKSGLLKENEQLSTPGARYIQELNEKNAHASAGKQMLPNKQLSPSSRKSPREKAREAVAEAGPRSRRSHSFNDYYWLNEELTRSGQSQVCLEQLVSMNQ